MTKKQIIITVASVGLATTFALAAFAQTGITNPVPADVKTKIACVGTAVSAREQAVGVAITAYTQSVNSAHSARATALQQAYAKTTLADVKIAVKTAWSDFNKAIKLARKTWNSARNTAWTQYKKTATACKAPANTGDGSHSSSEISGE